MHEFPCPPGLVCRPTFWNIPGFLEIVVYAAGILAVIVFLYGMWLRVKHWRTGKGKFEWGPLGARIKNWLTMGVATKKVVLDKPTPGLMHLGIMWGMAFLFLGTAIATIDWDITKPLINPNQWRLLQGDAYYFFKVVLDIFALVALIGIVVAFVIRYGVKPERLDGRSGKRYFREDLWILGSLGFIVLTGFIIEILRLAAQPIETAHLKERVMFCTTCSVVAWPLAQLLNGVDLNLLKGLHLTTWLGHMGVALVAAAAVP